MSLRTARRPRSSRTMAATTALLASSTWTTTCRGFTPIATSSSRTTAHNRRSTTILQIVAPPGSGYLSTSSLEEDEEDYDPSAPQLTPSDLSQISPPAFPKTYEPMLEYPGTMRPGRTPENMPYHDLPGLNVHDPNPVPWPHFQEIAWHHKWEPPHAQAPLMEDYIESQGRWASVEEEAEMR
eukprot:CAMPEP_0183750120 /NCGR_PEP_ID=MMETSP0739-20130205/827_1 /TAXON_ID=385413 /ORGANISM="Thalassiosira miniscula, Strain CCMP1093" /LENGTH=181 /DNA_ID=CAMNT_0025986057 /DNA_START=35 /DNA_END=577 /DNA_ORIENTATION=-